MNAAVAPAPTPVATASAQAPARIALLGTGTVGRAVLERLAAWEAAPDTAPPASLSLVHVANSRTWFRPDSVASARVRASRRAVAGPSASLDDLPSQLGDDGVRIVLDATASDLVADRHAEWLARGLHVVTACKLGQGTSLARWRAIRHAQTIGGARYGDSATVGAGLPVLHSIRALRDGGDRIHAVAGVLSGSLAWLFHHYDGLRPFSGFVRQAREAGYTEPDPRDDLGGEDVRRKLLILARAAGVALAADAVAVESLVPPALATLPLADLDAALPQLDAPLREHYAEAYKRGEKLRFIARLDEGRARVGLEALPADHPLAGGAGTDNRVAIWSDRYRVQPLVIQGPGAGAEVTAAAMLDDALAIVADVRRD